MGKNSILPMSRKISNKVTLYQVADHAGCSVAVASTVLNHSKGNKFVSDAMRQRVLAAAKELQYRPNFAARSLARSSTKTLGIYTVPRPWSGLGTAYSSLLIRGVESACRHHGYDLMLMNLTGQEPLETCLNKLAESRVDGLILLHAENGRSQIDRLRQVMANLVAVDTASPLAGIDSVMFDNAQAVRMAVEHLVSLGHRQIGFIASTIPDPLAAAAARHAAFFPALASVGLPERPEWVFDRSRIDLRLTAKDHYCQLEGYWGVRYFMSLKERPTAIVTYTDLTAVGAYAAMHEMELSIPRDLAVVSIGDSERALCLSPMLTAMDPQIARMGELAVNRLVERSRIHFEHRDMELMPMVQVVGAKLNLRGSTDPHHPGTLNSWSS